MNRDGWKQIVLDAANDPERLELLAALLEEQDLMRQRFQEIGIGCAGRPLLGYVEDVKGLLAELRKDETVARVIADGREMSVRDAAGLTPAEAIERLRKNETTE